MGALWAPLKPYTVDAYERVFANRNIATGYQNTLFVLAVGVPLNVILTTMGAYFLSLKNMRMGGVIMFLILFTRYFSGGMVPDYLNVKSLGLLNSLWALILPGAISSYNLIIMRTAFAAVPESLVESARLDGAKHYRILFSIIDAAVHAHHRRDHPLLRGGPLEQLVRGFHLFAGCEQIPHPADHAADFDPGANR